MFFHLAGSRYLGKNEVPNRKIDTLYEMFFQEVKSLGCFLFGQHFLKFML